MFGARDFIMTAGKPPLTYLGKGAGQTGGSGSTGLSFNSFALPSTGTSTVALLFVVLSATSGVSSTFACSATYGGTAMTQVCIYNYSDSLHNNGAGVAIFSLFNPASGTQTVTATKSAGPTATQFAGQVLLYGNAKTVSALTSATTGGTLSTTCAPSDTIATTDLLVAVAAKDNPQWTSITAGANNREARGASVGGFGDFLTIADIVGTGSTTTLTFTGSSVQNIYAAAKIAAA